MSDRPGNMSASDEFTWNDAGSSPAAAPKAVDASAVLQVLELYPLQPTGNGKSRKGADASPSPPAEPPLVPKQLRNRPALLPPAPPATQRWRASPSPSVESTSLGELPSVQAYRSSPAQLEGRVAAALHQQVALLLKARLREQQGRAAGDRRLAATLPLHDGFGPSGRTEAASARRHAQTGQTRGRVTLVVEPTADVPPAAERVAPSLVAGGTAVGPARTAAAAARHPPTGRVRPHRGTTGAARRAARGTALAGTHAGRRVAAAAEAEAEGEAAHADYSAVDLVRVHRLRGIPNHNRGLYADSQAPTAYTTRSGSMTVGGVGNGRRRVRPGAWGVLWEEGTAWDGRGGQPSFRRDPIAGLSGSRWLAQYEARTGNHDPSQGSNKSAGSSLVMRTFGSGGRTFFQWMQGGAVAAGGASVNGEEAEADMVAGTRRGYGRRPRSAADELSRGLGLDNTDDVEDVDAAINRVLLHRYGRRLTDEEREEARRRLRSKRQGIPFERRSTGDADGGEAAAVRAVHSSAAQQSSSSAQSRLDSALLDSKRHGSANASSGVRAQLDGVMDWAQLAIPIMGGGSIVDDGTAAATGEADSATPVSGADGSLNRTLNVAEAEVAAQRAARRQSLQRRQRQKKKGEMADTGLSADLNRRDNDAGVIGHSRPSSGTSIDTTDDSTSQVGQETGVAVVRQQSAGTAAPRSVSITLPNLPGSELTAEADMAHDPSGGASDQARRTGAAGQHGKANAGSGEGGTGLASRDVAASAVGRDRDSTWRQHGHGARRVDGGLDSLSDDEDSEAAREDGHLNMFLAGFPESVEHVRLRRQANNILTGLEGFGDDGFLPMPSFGADSGSDLWAAGTASKGAPPTERKSDAAPVSGFKLNEDKLREKFRREAEAEYADLIALRDELRGEVATQRALKEAFVTDVHKLSEAKVGEQFAVELTREVNQFAKEHGLFLQHIMESDPLTEDSIEGVAAGFLDRFWKGKAETRDVGTQVDDEDLGYVDEGVRTVEAQMQDLFFHEHSLLTAVKLAMVAVANIMSFHASLELESTCKECFYLFERPRTLWPCGHTFCQQCLAGMYNKRDELICAECGSVCEVGYTPNLSVELISSYQVVHSNDDGGGDEPWSSGTGPLSTTAAPSQGQTIEAVLRSLLMDLASTQKSCDSSSGMLPVQRA